MAHDNCFGLKSLTRLSQLVDSEAKRYEVTKKSIYVDMLRVFLKTRVGPNYYLLAGFSNPSTSPAEKFSHLNNKNYHRCLDILNPKEYRKITQNKLSEKAFLNLAKVPAAEFIACWNNRGGFGGAEIGTLSDASDLEALLLEYLDKKLCFKLLEGWGGKGFLAGTVLKINGKLAIHKLFSEEIVTLDDILAHFCQLDVQGAFLIESYIEQSKYYSIFNETSLNTARVWTLEKEDGQIQIIGGYLRIGRQGSLTDNGDGGGVMCPIDVETGEVGPGLFTNTPVREDIDIHPDNGSLISGVVLNKWPDIKKICKETLACLPETRFCGFDIGMSTSGPVIVEINVCPDKNGAAYGKFSSKILMDSIA